VAVSCIGPSRTRPYANSQQKGVCGRRPIVLARSIWAPGLLLEVACAHYQRHRNPSKRARNEEAKAVEEEKQGKRDTEVIRIVRKELCRSEDAPAVFPLYLCQIGTVPNASLKWLNVYELPRALVREYEASLPAADTSRIKKEEALAALSLAPQDPPEPMVSENPSSSVAASSLPPGHPHYASKVAFRRKQAKQLMLEIGKREEAILNATKDKSSAAAAAAPIPARAVRELAALSVQLVEKFPDVLLPDERTQLEEFAAAVQQMGSDAMAAGLCEGTSSSHPPLPRLACSAGDDSSSSPVAGSSHTGAQGEGSRIEASARGAPSGFPYELYEHFVIAHMKVSTLGAKLPLNDYDALWRLQQVAEEWAHDTIRHARKEGLNVVDVLSERLAAIEAERRRTRANSALPNQSRDDDPGSAGSHHSPPTHTQEQATPRTTPDTTTTTQPPDFVTGALAVEYRRRQSANRTHSGGLTPATFLSSLLQDVQGTQPPAYLLNHATDSGRLAQLHSWLASGAAVDVGAFTRLVVTAGKAVKSAASASAGDGGGGRSALADVVMRQYQGFYYGWLAPEMHRMKMPAHKQKPYADLFLKTRDCLKAMCANPNESPQTVHYYLQQLVFKFGAKLGEYRLRHPPTPTPAPAGAPQAPSLSVSAVPAPPQQPTCNGMPLPAAQPEQQPSVPAFPALFQAPYDNRSGSGLSAAAGQEARGGTEETGGVGHDAGGQVTHCAARDPPAAEEVPDEPSGGQHQEPQQQQPV